MQSQLEKLVVEEKFAGKGPLSVALVVTEIAKKKTFPLRVQDFLAESGGQVSGLGRAAVQAILLRHGIERVLAEEGGRTSRGSIAKMKAYVAFLNTAHQQQYLDLESAEQFWIDRVRVFFAAKPMRLRVDTRLGIRAALRQLLAQAQERQSSAQGSMLVGTFMQHMVGAKLEAAMESKIAIEHHSANQSDQQPGRSGDFDIGDVSVHVTNMPSEALLRKCQENIHAGKRPLIVTSQKGAAVIEGLAENIGIDESIDVIEFEQFLATNIHELGQFSPMARRRTIDDIVARYNKIVSEHETDPSLRIEVATGKS